MRMIAPVKTNAVRLLDRMGIAYELRTYDVDPDDLSAGVRGTQILLAPADYVRAVGAAYAAISKPK